MSTQNNLDFAICFRSQLKLGRTWPLVAGFSPVQKTQLQHKSGDLYRLWSWFLGLLVAHDFIDTNVYLQMDYEIWQMMKLPNILYSFISLRQGIPDTNNIMHLYRL